MINQTMIHEIRTHLEQQMIPFWESIRDLDCGGYYGLVDGDLVVHKEAVKGCILNSRILWFFSSAYELLGKKELLEDAKAAYDILKDGFMDREQGGVYWSIKRDKTPCEDLKHTYNQAFAIYALSAYYGVSKDMNALKTAYYLFDIIETKCKDSNGYLESFDRFFRPIENDKLSENGILASKTMNTLLHVFEAYTQLYKVTQDQRVKKQMIWILEIFKEKVYNPSKKRQEVFFDEKMNSLIDLHSYGHDIETAWLLDLGIDAIKDQAMKESMKELIESLEDTVYELAFNGDSLYNESEDGVIDRKKVWWVQAEAMVGYTNAYAKFPKKTHYLEAVEKIWEFCKNHLIDKREFSDWFMQVDEQGNHDPLEPIVDMWKCPYHTGRMCFEMIKRSIDQ